MKKKYKNILIKGEKIYLRPLTMKDVNKEYLSWLDDKENSRYTVDVLKSTMTSLKNYVYKFQLISQQTHQMLCMRL